MAFLQGIALAIEALLKDRERWKVHGMLTRFWIRIDETAIPELHRIAAHLAIRILSIFRSGKWWSFRSISRLSISSFILTTIAFEAPFLILFHTFGVWAILIGSVVGGFHSQEVLWAMLLTFLVNLICDIPTVIITYKLLFIVFRAPVWKSLLAIFGDILAAIFLALICLNLLSFIDLYTEHSGRHIPTQPDNLTKQILLVKVSIEISELSSEEKKEESEVIINEVIDRLGREKLAILPVIITLLYAGTTLIPTALYLSIILLLILSKALVSGVRWFILEIIERATPADYRQTRAFSLLAILINIFILIGKLVHALVAS